MNNTNFEIAVEKILSRVRENLLSKAKEYATDADRLHNFNLGVQMTGNTREDVIWGIALKHLISVTDIRTDIAKGKLPEQHFLDEKLGDWITYMTLLYASIQDKLNESEQLKKNPYNYISDEEIKDAVSKVKL